MKEPVRQAGTAPAEPAWGAVFSLTLGVSGLVTAEFLPASLLTPMAADLHVGEAMAGQAVTATAAVALLLVSNLAVAFAPDLQSLLVGRVLLGVALGGFWAMSAAIAMRLVPEATIPRALSMLFSGVSAATVFAAPVGSYLGDLLDWRAVFLMAGGLGLAALVAQVLTLPRMAPNGHTSLRTLGEVMARPGVGLGMVSIILVFTGHFALFTYVRPFLETVTGVGVGVGVGVSGAGGVFGASGIVRLLAALVVLGGVRARAVAVTP